MAKESGFLCGTIGTTTLLLLHHGSVHLRKLGPSHVNNLLGALALRCCQLAALRVFAEELLFKLRYSRMLLFKLLLTLFSGHWLTLRGESREKGFEFGPV